ncbi:hypothetical protein MYX78_11000 [Acidobacteria bacterium AH-259-G07]|nr:hypothetical protein [Acidobacteria bacterium AH-259-G07]
MRQTVKRRGSWLKKNSHFPAGETQIRVRTHLDGLSDRKRGRREAGRLSAQSTAASVDDESWKLDEHWAAVTAYVAEMYFPNEG